MAIYLSDDDVRKVLTTEACVGVLEDLFRHEAEGLVENLPRRRMRLARGGGTAGTLMGGVTLGSQAYLVRHSNVSLLYNTENGHLEAVLPPSTVAWMRTGAASGVATKYMARPEASVVGIIGTGRQAVTQLEAICSVRPIKLVKAYSRTAENRERFAREMQERLDVEVRPVASTDECVAGSDVVTTITNSREPVFDGNLLRAGMHVNAAGANSWTRREVDEATIQRANLVVVDNLEQAKMECGELIWAAERSGFNWRKAVELHEVVSGKVSGRPDPQAITLFESQGIGIEDAAASAYVLARAREQGLGQELPF